MNFVLFVTFLILALVPTGCSPSRKIVVYPPPDFSREQLSGLAPVQEAEARAAALDRLLREGSLVDEDREAVSHLASAYRALVLLASSAPARPDFIHGVERLLANMREVERAVLSRRATRTLEPVVVMERHGAKGKEILDAFAAGDHRTVLKRCEDLKAVFGPQGLTPELGAVFAASLAREGRLPEAILVAGTILRDMENRPGPVSLGADLAQWHLEAGERQKAVDVYHRIAEIHEEQSARVRSVGENIAVRDVPPTPRIPMSGEPDPQKRPEALRALDEAERIHERVGLASLAGKEQGLADARRLMDEERYPEALSLLDRLAAAEGGAEDREARELREKAVERLIERERNRAARLFLAARQTPDREKKHQYLRASLEILQGLVDQYPASPLIDKVRAHRDRVREELEKR